jgi:hypothetical protein
MQPCTFIVDKVFCKDSPSGLFLPSGSLSFFFFINTSLSFRLSLQDPGLQYPQKETMKTGNLILFAVTLLMKKFQLKKIDSSGSQVSKDILTPFFDMVCRLT